MARLPRLAVAGHAHLVLLRGHGGEAVFRDDTDRAAFLAALRVAFSVEPVALHGYAVLPARVWLLCTPASAQGIGRVVQSMGRGFSAAFNRRHRRTGAVWDGRYRAAVIEDGATLLDAMLFVDQAPVRERQASDALAADWSSARQHVGLEGEYVLTDAEPFWALGNTPFDRCAAYRALLDEPQSEAQVKRFVSATQRGWAVGSPAFLDALSRRSHRQVAPRPRGRPRKHAPS